MILDKFSLKGKSGIVTGGGTGLGKGIAAALVQAGGSVLIVGRRMDVLEKTAKELSAYGGPVIPFSADVSQMGPISKIVERALKEFGRIDFLVNNAGAIRRAPVENYSEADWDVVVQTNLKGPFFLSQAVARTMIEAKRAGAIVNTASLIAYIGGKNVPAYAASKAGIKQLTMSMANAWAPYGIRVNAIAPGWFVTDLTEAVQKDKGRNAEILSRIPMGRWGNPDELGGAALYLVCDASSYVTGQTFVVDGGWLAN
ncbi:MAG: 2-deoxy-D-gluconate 3-dehydrogenase [Deltaproteobacteria bacterium]|nr:2-deoxy-D-gluconate 3-dehydrogenase [Deltaproteobacteria bacterium]